MKALELIHLRTAGVVQASQQFYHSATLGTLSSSFNLLKLKPAPLSVPSGESNNFFAETANALPSALYFPVLRNPRVVECY